MLGHYLLTLDRAAEDRILTGKLAQGAYLRSDGWRCLVGAAAGFREGADPSCPQYYRLASNPSPLGQIRVEDQYDALMDRFGERVNTAIRTRILSNRARRLLTQAATQTSRREEALV